MDRRFLNICAGLLCLGFVSLLPATVGAQCPNYLAQWGSSGSGDGQFSYTSGVARDAGGSVYVTGGNNRVQKFTDTGTYLTQWGSNGSGDGQFFNPTGVAVDADGGVYVVDTNNHRIQKFTGTGAYLTQWGSYGTGNAEFRYPSGVAVNAAGEVYVADSANYRIQKFGSVPTPVKSTTWGRIKSLYR